LTTGSFVARTRATGKSRTSTGVPSPWRNREHGRQGALRRREEEIAQREQRVTDGDEADERRRRPGVLAQELLPKGLLRLRWSQGRAVDRGAMISRDARAG
jgi:hypothetical protein